MFTGEMMMSHPENTHDNVFAQSEDPDRKAQRTSNQASPPTGQAQSPESKSVHFHSASRNLPEPEVQLAAPRSQYVRHVYDDDQNSRLGVYVSIGLLIVAVAIGAYWLGTSSDQFFGTVPRSSGHAAEDEELSRHRRELSTPSTSANQHSQTAAEKHPAVSNDPRAAETRLADARPRALPATTNLDLVVHRLARLDDEFSRLKVDLVDLKHAEELRTQDAIRTAAVTKAISTGQLRLRASADPKSNTGIQLVYVPAGRFVMGQTEDQRSESARASASAHYDFSFPAHPVHVQSGYFIGVYEVTIGQIAEFAAQQIPEEATTATPRYSSEMDRNKPACFIDWITAMKYCDWLSQLNNGITIRLPTEIEWEYAARGNTFIQQFESLRERDVVLGGPWPVDTNTLDRSWCGSVAMNSNVQEWTIDAWDEKAYQRRDLKPGSSRPNTGFLYTGFKENNTHPTNAPRAVRGSSFRDIAANKDTALRRFKPANAKEDTLGFRIVVPIDSELKEGE